MLGLSAFERDLLDAFHDPRYRRGSLPVIVEEELHEADCYLPVEAASLDWPNWDLVAWQQRQKPLVLAATEARIAELRLKLIAVRPN